MCIRIHIFTLLVLKVNEEVVKINICVKRTNRTWDSWDGGCGDVWM